MPRYFFHMNAGDWDPDLDGTELPSLDAAKREAIVYAGQSIRDQPYLVSHSGELHVEVTGDDGAIVSTIIVQAIGAPVLDTFVRKIGR